MKKFERLKYLKVMLQNAKYSDNHIYHFDLSLTGIKNILCVQQNYMYPRYDKTMVGQAQMFNIANSGHLSGCRFAESM